MGSRSSAYCCQKFTNAISFILFKIGIYVLNYLDDLASAKLGKMPHLPLKQYNLYYESVALKKQKIRLAHLLLL